MSSLLIKNGRVIDPASNLDAVADVLLRDGLVAEIGANLKSSRETFNARGLIVAPGLIDLHVHLREPGQFHKETIATGTAAAAAGGFTSVCCMPNTNPVNDLPAITRWMQAPERGAVVNVFPIAAATAGSAGEKLSDFAALQRAGAIAVTDDGKPILDPQLMRQALTEAHALGMPVIQHAEDTRITQGRWMHDGPTAFRLGIRGISGESESRIVARDIELARETGGHIHVAHLSTALSLDAVRAGKRRNIRVTCEVTPHHLALIDEDVGEYDTNCKMNPPLRSREDRAGLLSGIADGTVDCIATDHAPHAHHEKNVEFDRAPFGLIGLETALPLAITLLHAGRAHVASTTSSAQGRRPAAAPHIPLHRIIELLSTNPARIAGLNGRGTLAPGSIADVVIFDPKKQWTYDVSKSPSKSRNTPFDGWKLMGQVVATVVGGRIVFHS